MPIAAVNGTTLYYEESGSGPPLLLMHGTGAYSGMWSPVVESLARTYRVIAYDRRGFAGSSRATRNRLADHALDAAALLDALDASPATVVGWSGGGVIALDLAASDPARVAHLVLAEPAVHSVKHPTRSVASMLVRSSIHRYLRRDNASAARTMYRWASGYSTGGNAWDGFPPAWQEQMLEHAVTTVREMDQLRRVYPSRAAIESITCPVTLIVGDLSDTSFLKIAAYVGRLLPHARTVTLPGAAHMLHIDKPKAWVEAVAPA